MANFVGLRLQTRLTVVGGVCSCCCATHPPHAVTAVVVGSSSLTNNWNRRIKASPRRMLLGFGASFFLPQFMSMSGSSTVPAKSFIASARIKAGPSVDEILKNMKWPEQFPFKEEDFQRYDESPDSSFYKAPRFVMHIDDPAIAALTKYYSKVFPPRNTPGVSILDMCSSWPFSIRIQGRTSCRIRHERRRTEEEPRKTMLFLCYVVCL